MNRGFKEKVDVQIWVGRFVRCQILFKARMSKLLVRYMVVYNARDHLVEFKVGVSVFAIFLIQDVHSRVIVDPRNDHVVDRHLLELFNIV